MSPNYLVTLRGLRELHRLTVAGRLDSPEADAVRDATDVPWEALDELEKKRLSGLSEDLYSITDSPRSETKESNPQAQARLADIAQANQIGDWNRVLELSRRWGAYIEPSTLSYWRGAAWANAGDPETAEIFYKHASDLQPNNGNYLAIWLATLNKTAPTAAEDWARKILQHPVDLSPNVVVTASNILFNPVRELGEAEASRFFREIIPTLTTALERLEAGDEGGRDDAVFTLVCYLLGFSHEFLRENQAASAFYSKGLGASPTNDALLVARGILRYGESPLALEDFKLAIQSGTTLVWPYSFLAHHHVMANQFEQARVFCERGLEMNGSNSARSELAELLAISQSALGFPIEIVRSSFELATRLNPFNEQARRNFAAFETAIQPIRLALYETRTRATVKASGLSERRLARVA